MQDNLNNFIQTNSPDRGFLQSEEWRKFQESAGRNTYNISSDGFYANIVEHKLPLVGKYFYVPRGPVISDQRSVNSEQSLKELTNLARKENAGWIRIEPANEEVLNYVKNSIGEEIEKAPHDVQPREIFVTDITKTEEELLAGIKAKTRYNIRLATRNSQIITRVSNSKKDIEEFLRLNRIMARRQGIATHPDEYYRKMLEMIPGKILKLYLAEHDNKIIAAILVVFYGKIATYFHGASDDEFRNVMAPHLLQWRQIQDAKRAGCARYDFGGIKTPHPPSPSPAGGRGWREAPGEGKNKWKGITRFKLSFSPDTKPLEFPGSYDIIIDKKKYFLYKFLQKVKNIF